MKHDLRCDPWWHTILLISLFNGVSSILYERYDGWYNNIANPEWGATGDEIVYDVPAAYSDMTYKPSGQDRPNPRVVSNNVFSGPSGLPSWDNRTALFAFFGQMVAYEMVHAADSTCPVEMERVPIPPDDDEFVNSSSNYNEYMPFIRSGYNRKTGQAPNNPRKPINKVSSWIDGSHIYGRGEVWCNCLRSFMGGQFASVGANSQYPGLNKIRLPLDSYPSPVTHNQSNPEEQWMFGDPHVHQNPGLTAMALVWFRYHNAVAKQLQTAHADWKDEIVFTEARKRVIATLQNIIVYEWMPVLLGKPLPAYDGYKQNVRPSISVMFEAAAFRLGHSYIPPGLYLRDRKCHFKSGAGAPIRLCNSYWHSQRIIEKYGMEELILGMASQIMEREDHVLVDDLRGKMFGPLHYSRHDLTVLTLMRGRDHGLPDYNTAREALGLPKVTKWKDINPWLEKTDKQVLDRLIRTYKSLSKVDVYTGGILESSPQGPGPLFTKVIVDQFQRIRDGDRYWFENRLNGMFTEDEISEIQNMTLRDVIVMATGLGRDDIQANVFLWKDGDPCPQPRQLTADHMEPCTPHHGYDYFKGSEVSYVIVFTSFCLLPFVCILIAFLVAKYKKRKEMKWLRKWNARKQSVENQTADGVYHAMEWTGHKTHPHDVHIQLDSSTCSLVVASGRKCLRTINLKKYDNLSLWVSNDKWKDVLMIGVPREYDLVLRFPSETNRRDFLSAMTSLLKEHTTSTHVHELPHRDIFSKAITKARREQLITQFFKNIFLEASTDTDAPPSDQDFTQAKEIVECELSREEFAEALALKPDSLFVDQMFFIVDRDGNGYVSFRELLNAVTLFAKGSSEDKLQLLFAMYDRNKSGSLNRDEVSEMIGSMMEMANAKLPREERDNLVHEMFVSAGLENSDILQFTDFAKVLSGQMHMLWDVSIDWKGTEIYFNKKEMKKRRNSEAPRSSQSNAFPTFDDAIVKNPLHPTQAAMKLTMIQHYLENHRQHIVYLFIYFSICALIFAERFYYFAVEQEHRGFRRILGDGLSVTRGAAGVMSFSFSLLLLTMCRNTITKLRETVLNLYIPFDSNVAFHKVVAYTALLFTMLHILGYAFNFYHAATQPVQFLCVIDEIFFRSDFSPKFHFWLFQNLTGITGVLLVIVICIIYIFATGTARTHIFNAFWITHQLFYALYILTLLHGCARLVQEPYFPYYFIPPAAVFTVDKMVSLSQKKKAISVVNAELLPSDVTTLEFKRPSSFEYRSGQWVRLACDELGSNEYHSLTLTSAPHEENLSVHIRAVGPWTKNIHKVFDPATLSDKPYPKLYVDGPFGAGQQDWFRYDVSILIGGGIGITPYASILKDFAFLTSVKNTIRIKCHKVYFIWVTASQKHFEWLMDILRQAEEVDTKGVVETHIFITQFFQRFDLRTTMLYICEEHFQKMSGRSMFSGLKAKTHFGRPDFDKVFDAVQARHPKTRKIGVFSCGPPGLTKGSQQACYSSSKRGKARFEHHFENF